VQFPEGIEYVFVNGQAVVDCGVYRPKTAARFCGNKKSDSSSICGRRQSIKIIILFAAAPFPKL
jgi:hypothetical protein